jgi:signal transduction histidine kinase
MKVPGTPDYRVPISLPSVALLWDERWRLRLLAVASVGIALVAIGEGGFRARDWALLPFAAAGFVLLAAFPALPNLVAALPAVALPLVDNMTDTNVEFAMFLPVLALTLTAYREPNRRLVIGLYVTTVGAIFVLSITGVYDWTWPNWIMGITLGWTFGTLVHHYDRVLAELRSTQARIIDQATPVERRRIARDVHDLIGHSLSVVTLHVAGARRLVRTDPDEAEAALLQAEQASRDAMSEVRRTVGLMREEGDQRAGPAPTPDLSDIATVVDQYRAAGLPIEYHVDGPIDRVDGPRAVAVYHIAQEALANVTRHTIESVAEVFLEVTDETCRLQVLNRGGRVVRPAGQEGHVGGNGLAGMRERAQSVGGSLLVGPMPDGWSVDATVPLAGPSGGQANR